jgi:hypothetical protein
MSDLAIGDLLISLVFRRAQSERVPVVIPERHDTDPAAPVDRHQQLVVGKPGRQPRPLHGMHLSQVLVHRAQEQPVDHRIGILGGAEHRRLPEMLSPVPRLDAGLRHFPPFMWPN